MASYTVVETNPESKSEKRVRYFLTFLFFLQTVCTTLPFMQGTVGTELKGISALQLLIQPDGYSTKGDIMLAVIGGLLVVMPIVAFFFCLLDSTSKIKFLVSGITAVLSAVLICFGQMLSIGSVFTLILNVVCLFMTMQGVQATNIRRREAAGKEKK